MWGGLGDVTRAEASQAMAGVRARLEAWVRTVDEVFSTWRDDSLAIGLRRGLLTEADLCDLGEHGRLMAGEIARCRDLRALTRGAFDPWAAPGGFDPSGRVKGWAAERLADPCVGAA